MDDVNPAGAPMEPAETPAQEGEAVETTPASPMPASEEETPA